MRASQGGNETFEPANKVEQILSIVPGVGLMTDVQRLANGMLTLRFYGETGTDYVVQGSTNLVSWQPLWTNQVSSLGYLGFVDATSTNFNRRFYRIAP